MRRKLNRLEITGGNWGEVFAVPGVTRICRGVNGLGDYAYLNGNDDPEDGFAYAGDALEWLDGERRAKVVRGEANRKAWTDLIHRQRATLRGAARERAAAGGGEDNKKDNKKDKEEII